MIAFLSLPKVNTPVDGVFTNLNGYWVPPVFVISQWCGVCSVEYESEKQFAARKEQVLDSYNNCLKQFYMENAL